MFWNESWKLQMIVNSEIMQYTGRGTSDEFSRLWRLNRFKYIKMCHIWQFKLLDGTISHFEHGIKAGRTVEFISYCPPL